MELFRSSDSLAVERLPPMQLSLNSIQNRTSYLSNSCADYNLIISAVFNGEGKHREITCTPERTTKFSMVCVVCKPTPDHILLI